MRLFALIFLSLSFVATAMDTENPWFDIRKARISTLLPDALKAANVDAWMIVCRENNNDPLAKHVGCENAGKTAVIMFYLDGDGMQSRAFSPITEATALKDMNLYDEVVPVARDASSIELAAGFIKQLNFESIAVNVSETNPQADGLSHTQYLALTQALGELSGKLVSSDNLVYEWLAIKLPQEVELMRRAATLTAQWQLDAYARVIPGETTDADVAKFLKGKMAAAGVTDAWSADQNPNVVSGTDRGHSHATNKVIMPGDVIQTDFGIRVHDTWVTDIQRFAYVLRPGEIEPPADILRYWQAAKNGRAAAFNAMRPGATGQSVDAAQRQVLQREGSREIIWSTGHPVGYEAHDTGPALSDGLKQNPRQASLLPLKPGMTFAFDGFYSWLLPDGNPKTISVEEMVVITNSGAQYLIPPQQDLVLIPSATME